MENYLTKEPIPLSEILGEKSNPTCGATFLFMGTVRNHHQNKTVTKLFYDCHEPLANQTISQIIKEHRDQFKISRIQVIHRIGWLNLGDIALVVLAQGAHRKETILACDRTIEEIKKRVPIWKHEYYLDETEQWL